MISDGLVCRTGQRRLIPFDLEATGPLRGFMALLIVAHHVGISVGIDSLNMVLMHLGAPVVSVFFFISGYGLCRSYGLKGRKYLDGFLRKRYSKLLPSFLLLTFLSMAIVYLCEGRGVMSQLRDLVVNGETPLPNSWFIYSIVFFYAAFYVCGRVMSTALRLGLMLAGLSVLSIVLLHEMAGFPDYWSVTFMCTSAGFFTAYFEAGVSRILSRRYYCVTGLLFLLTMVLFASGKVFGKIHYLNAIQFCGFAMLVYCLVRGFGFPRRRILVFLGDISLELYLVHGFAIYACERFSVPAVWVFVLTYGWSIPAAMAVGWFGKRFSRFLLPDVEGKRG